MTTVRFLVSTLVATAGFLAIGIWALEKTPRLGAAFIAAAFVLAVWAIGSYRKQMWAWRAAMVFCYAILALALSALVGIVALYILGYGIAADTFIQLAVCALLVLVGAFFSFRRSLAFLRSERQHFDPA